MNLERVKDKVKKGGHFIDDDKIEKRYFLTMNLLIDMLKEVDETYLWDNSGTKHYYLGNINEGILNLGFLNIPNWVDTYILNKIKS